MKHFEEEKKDKIDQKVNGYYLRDGPIQWFMYKLTKEIKKKCSEEGEEAEIDQRCDSHYLRDVQVRTLMYKLSKDIKKVQLL